MAEFSYLQTSGTYRLLAGGAYSDSFEIDDNLLFSETVGDVIGYFNKSRADNERLHGDGYFIADDGNRPFWHASWYLIATAAMSSVWLLQIFLFVVVHIANTVAVFIKNQDRFLV